MKRNVIGKEKPPLGPWNDRLNIQVNLSNNIVASRLHSWVATSRAADQSRCDQDSDGKALGLSEHPHILMTGIRGVLTVLRTLQAFFLGTRGHLNNLGFTF